MFAVLRPRVHRFLLPETALKQADLVGFLQTSAFNLGKLMILVVVVASGLSFGLLALISFCF